MINLINISAQQNDLTDDIHYLLASFIQISIMCIVHAFTSTTENIQKMTVTVTIV